ncbi:hypothetical protein SRB5_41880 [Streptomyces sp. RB5]|uniref:Uncharacterized protein n=1 Tax=Streptomyces smaragdinus TaxID=2585196 RepID=A0A7K0CKM3_9ACTN|nr:hypothetical protein [Streptomyces smaragdinus]MQY14027.1 hypothetical protein [Streptomyces smaragdinus]
MSTDAGRVSAQGPGAPGYPAPVRPPRAPGGRRSTTAVVCLLLGLAALTVAAVGTWAGHGPDVPADVAAFDRVREMWHSEPVDALLPPTLRGDGAGPGGADRTWTRIVLAPDSGCAGAFDPALAKELAPVGCERLLRATYTDATGTDVITVGLLFARAEPAPWSRAAARFEHEGVDSRARTLPRPVAGKDTPAARFGDHQRASWAIGLLPDAPVVVYAVSGFADGREIGRPQPAAEAMLDKQTSAAAQSGLGDEAQGVADGVEAALRARITATAPGEDR